MNSVPLLLAAAATVGFLHAILPDHWVPLAVIARTRRWTMWRTARITLLASGGHVLTSILLGGVIALIGLQFRSVFEAQQSHIVGATLTVTGLVFMVIGVRERKHPHPHSHEHGQDHAGDNLLPHEHDHSETSDGERHSAGRRLANIAIPFGAAASPDLTILPIFLAASAIGFTAVTGVLAAFSVVTIATFLGLTLSATAIGYQVKGEWLERNGNTITGFVLVLIGVAVLVNVV
jgi:nickel/cobalt transporter (NicO) family protein